MQGRLSKIAAALVLLLSAHGQPLLGQVQVSGDMTLTGRGAPGGSYEGVIKLRNIGGKAEEVRLYLKDYLFFSAGTSIYDEPGTNERSNALWIEFYPNIINIAPGAEAEIGYRVQVPDDKALTGTYWSLLFVEEVPGTADVPVSEDKFTLSIRQVVRYGIQIVTEIGDTGFFALEFQNPALNLQEAAGMLSVEVVNTGTIWLRPKFSCRVYDLLGTELALIEGGERRLYPGTSARAEFSLPSLDAGRYRALVLADGGGENLYGANYTLEIEE